MGYTSSRKEAGRYTRSEALAICTGANLALDDEQEPRETMLQDA